MAFETIYPFDLLARRQIQFSKIIIGTPYSPEFFESGQIQFGDVVIQAPKPAKRCQVFNTRQIVDIAVLAVKIVDITDLGCRQIIISVRVICRRLDDSPEVRVREISGIDGYSACSKYRDGAPALNKNSRRGNGHEQF